MESIIINGIEFLPHTWPLLIGFGLITGASALASIVWGIYNAFKWLR